MATQYKLHPVELHTTTVGDRVDSICAITWTYIGISDDTPKLSCEKYGTTFIDSSNTSEEDYVSLVDVTEEMVLGWIQADMERDASEYEYDGSIKQCFESFFEESFAKQKKTRLNYQMPWYGRPTADNPSAENSEE